MSRNKVLVVDDESGIRFGIRDFLEQHGYEIEEAESCDDAQQLFRNSRPDIVIADYMLPDGTARIFSLDMDAKSLITEPSFPDKLTGPGWWEIRGIAWSGRGKIARVDFAG